MKVLILFVGWCILLVLCWPLALLALVLLPVVWLVIAVATYRHHDTGSICVHPCCAVSPSTIDGIAEAQL